MDSNESLFRLVSGSSRNLVLIMLATAVWNAGEAVSVAQTGFGRPNNRPTVSPYLNLFRNQNRGGFGNSTLLNYYGLVRPQNQTIERGQELSQGLYNLQQRTQQPHRTGHRGIPRYSQMGITGHPTAFMTVQPGVGTGSGFVGGGGFGASGFGNVGGAIAGFGQVAIGSGNTGPEIGGDFSSSVPLGAFGGYGPGTVTGHAATFGTGTGRGSLGIGN